MKKILIINGHPFKYSLSSAITERYFQGANRGSNEIKVLNISELKFDPILHKGYQEIQQLEPDLIKAQNDIAWADHLVVIFPIWWSSPPALFKGFIDRVFLPGFAFKYHPGKTFWDKLLKGRTSEIILTTDAPNWWNKWILNDPAINMIKKGVLEFSGFKVIRVTSLAEIKNQNHHSIERILNKIEKLGERI